MALTDELDMGFTREGSKMISGILASVTDQRKDSIAMYSKGRTRGEIDLVWGKRHEERIWFWRC